MREVDDLPQPRRHGDLQNGCHEVDARQLQQRRHRRLVDEEERLAVRGIVVVMAHTGTLHDEMRIGRPPNLPGEMVRCRRRFGPKPQAELEAALVRPVVVRVATVHPSDRRNPERELGHTRQRADIEPLERFGHGECTRARDGRRITALDSTRNRVTCHG